MNTFTQRWLRQWRPSICGAASRSLYAADNVSIAPSFRADSLPRILIDPGATLRIDAGVEFRRNVEIRVHGNASVTIGRGARIDRGVRILAANEAIVQIGAGARIGLYSVLNGGDSISIGEKALLSGFVYLQTSMHRHKNAGEAIQDQGYDHSPVVLGHDAWLGAHVVIMPGVSIGDGAVIGSNAVVNRSVESFQVVAGVPAKPISQRAV